MSKTIVAVFEDQSFAERAAQQLQSRGYRTDDISIVTKPQSNNTGAATATMKTSEASVESKNDNISDGVLTGGLVGGLAGLLIGAGSMVVPGLGIVAAAGPLAGLLSGAVTGGLVGGLIDLGIPENRSKQYESEVKEGRVLFSMKTNDASIEEIKSILQSNGAVSVETY